MTKRGSKTLIEKLICEDFSNGKRPTSARRERSNTSNADVVDRNDETDAEAANEKEGEEENCPQKDNPEGAYYICQTENGITIHAKEEARSSGEGKRGGEETHGEAAKDAKEVNGDRR